MDEAAMIEAMAGAICERRNAPDWPCNGLDFDKEMARVALAEISRMIKQMEAKNKRLREALEGVIGLAENFISFHEMNKPEKDPSIIEARAALAGDKEPYW